MATSAHVLATAVRPIEFGERGSGPPVLIVHGTPGGYDLGLLGLEFASMALRLIAPSRPGYLGTPLGTGRTPAQQADALAALCSTHSVSSDPGRWSILLWAVDLPAGSAAS